MSCQLIESPEEYVDRSFQDIVGGFLDSSKNILVLRAPTGAGKTRAFSKLYSDKYKSIIVMPNNVLIEQNFAEFSSFLPEINKVTAAAVNENMNKWQLNKKDTISRIIEEGSLIFTNPTLFLFMLSNFYEHPGSRSDQISNLILSGLKCVVLDEFHVYSRDQKYRLLALISIFRKKIKFIISSATLEDDVVSLLKEIVQDNELELVNVSKSGKDFIRGPIEYDLHPEEPLIVIDQHIKDLKEGRWFLILDSIRDCHKAKELMVKNGFDPDEICLLNRLDLSKCENRQKAIESCFTKRIVIASNIVEQGYNPPTEFTNFLIARGYYGHNLRQRAGRVGRGIKNTCHLIISTGDQGIINRALEKVKDGIDIIEKLSEEIGEKSNSFGAHTVGIYAGILLEFFTSDARKILVSEATEGGNPAFASGVKTSILAISRIAEIQKKAEGLNCEELIYFCRWFTEYRESFRRFIGDREEVTFLFDDQKGNDLEQYRYDAIWMLQNADFQITDDGIRLSKFKEKPDRNFNVSIIGFPYTLPDNKEVESEFSKIYNKERKEILNRLKLAFKFLATCYTLDSQTKGIIEEILEATASPERLSLKVSDHWR